ncbi:MAG: hypothetical protein ABR549_19500, partial [Mycobacteriales bacterium]
MRRHRLSLAAVLLVSGLALAGSTPGGPAPLAGFSSRTGDVTAKTKVKAPILLRGPKGKPSPSAAPTATPTATPAAT